MGHDDYEDAIPGDEDAEDFANFDPQSYLRKRGHNLDNSTSPDPEGDPDNFANFDPANYVRKRRTELGREQLNQSPDEVASSYGQGRRRGRRRPSTISGESDMPELGGAVGLGAGIVGMLGRGEGMRLYTDILRQGGPVLRPIIVGIGCFLVLAFIGICAFGYLVITSLSRR